MKAKEKQLLEYLKKHCLGQQNALGGEKLMKVFRISGTELRKLVHNLRVDGAPICSDRTGYFYSANAWEVIATIGHLRRMRDGVERPSAAWRGPRGPSVYPGEVGRIAKPFFPWVGGKLFLLPYIFQLLPRRAPRLLEVCGGSGAVTLGLGAGYAPLRVYNDVDVDLANLFRCARDRPWRCSGSWTSCPSTPGRTSRWCSASSTTSMTPWTTWRTSFKPQRTTSRPWTGRR